ncbi:MAG: peptidylprolyl isomerase, partial [Planctomycetota bacterium]
MNPRKNPVPAIEETPPTFMERVEENRKILVGLGVLAVVLILGIVLFNLLGRQAQEEEWYRLYSARPPLGNATTLGELADSGSSDFRAHALFQMAHVATMKRDYAGAIAALDRIEAECGDTLLARLPSPDRRTPLYRLLRERVAADTAWEEKHGYDDDPKIDDDRVALIETDHGAVWVGFYPEYAPKHVEAFIAKAKAGAYNDTLFYLVTPSQLRFGGETTKDSDDFNDATAAENQSYVAPDKGRYRIEHRRGMISAVAFDEGEAIEKLTINLSPVPSLNKRQTIFAAVLKARGRGMAPLDDIRNEAVTYARSEDPLHQGERYVELAEHPVDPIRVTRISIWTKDKIEDGHTWDTSVVDAEAAEEKEAEEKPADEQPEEKPDDEQPDEKP